MIQRQLRKRKENPVSHIPTILDDIVVCWELDGLKLWWPASVIEVFEHDNPTNDIYGNGTLLYKKYKKYPAEEEEIQFLFTKRRGHLLTQVYNGRKLHMTCSPSGSQPLEDEDNKKDDCKSSSPASPNILAKRRGDTISSQAKRRSLDNTKSNLFRLTLRYESITLTMLLFLHPQQNNLYDHRESLCALCIFCWNSR